MQPCLKEIIDLGQACAFMILEVILLKLGHHGMTVQQLLWKRKRWDSRKLFFWLAELGMSSVSIQLDCKLMIDGIMDKSTNQTEFSIIVNDSNMLHSNYPNFGENSKLNLERQNYMSVVASLITCHFCVCHVLMNEII